MTIENDIYSQGLVKTSLKFGGEVRPLIIPASDTKGTGLFNPSVYLDGNTLFVNVRHCQYTILHAEKGKFEHQWGPLVYLCPENDLTLTTTNFLCRLNLDTLEIEKYNKVDTSLLDVKPIWEFVGLEDARIVCWNKKLYLTGVRRDTTPNGVGRMELSEIEVTDNEVKEISRVRLPAPAPDTSYCEKNWMPVLDLPYHYVKWSNPTEVVKVNPNKRTCETVYLGQYIQKPYDYRGGSQVIKYKQNYRIALAHIVTKFHTSEAGRKNAQYRQAFIVWDKDWNVIKYTEPFSFMNGEIEFCCGMAKHKKDYLISFGFQDNAAYILKLPAKVLEDFLGI